MTLGLLRVCEVAPILIPLNLPFSTHNTLCRFYDKQTKRWTFPLHAFDDVMAAVQSVPGKHSLHTCLPHFSIFTYMH